jgi:hypothetical protein
MNVQVYAQTSAQTYAAAHAFVDDDGSRAQQVHESPKHALNPVMNYIYNYVAVDFGNIIAHNSEASACFCANLVRSWLLVAAEKPDSHACVLVTHVRETRRKLYLKGIQRTLAESRVQPQNNLDSYFDSGKLWYLGKFAGVLRHWLSSHVWSVLGVLNEEDAQRNSINVEHSKIGSTMGGSYDGYGRSYSGDSVDHEFHSSATKSDRGLYMHTSSSFDATGTPASSPIHAGIYQQDYSFSPSQIRSPAQHASDIHVFKSLRDIKKHETASPLADKCRCLLLLFAHNRRLVAAYSMLLYRF